MASAGRSFARAFTTSRKAHGTVYNVAVIGAGVVGTGVAQIAAQAGHDVALVDLTDGALQRSRDNIIRSLDRIIKQEFKDGQQGKDRFRSDVLGRISLTTDAKQAVSAVDLVIEAVQEDLERKIKVFKELDLIAPKSAVFVTNTSSYSIRELAKATQRADRFGALHFFNPVTVLKLVEVIRSPETCDAAYAMMLEFSQSLGKTTLLCKDTPGFIVNRLLVPYLMEAVRMLERGDARARDIDTAMKLGAGYPMGPIQLLDFVGLDVFKSVIDGWHKLYPNEPLFKPSPLLERLVSEGNIGVKVGKGFYTYK